MSEPEPTSDSPGGSPTPPGSPYLLALPALEGMPPAIRWPGQEGAPGWAIPVQVPDGTLGYALFLPLVSATTDAPTGDRDRTDAPTGDRDRTDAPRGDRDGPEPAAAAATPTAALSPSSAPAQPAPATAPTLPEPAAVPSQPGPTAATVPTQPGPATACPAAPTARSDGGPAAAAGDPAGGVSAPAGPVPADPPATTAGQGAAAGSGQGAAASPGQGVTVPAPRAGAAAAAGGRPVPHWGGSPTPWIPQPPPPSFLSTRWPGPRPGSGWAVPAAVLAGALGVAFFVPLSRTGIGWFLGWLILTAGVVAAVRKSTGALTRTDRLIRGGWAVAALALLTVLAFRNAWWLVTFCVFGALGCATLAIVGGRQVRSILFSLVAAPFAALRGLPWVRRHVTATGTGQVLRRVVGSVVATVLVLLVFGLLLSSADAAFNEVLGAVVPEINVPTVVRWLFLAAVGGLIAVAAVYTLAAPPDLSTVDRESRRRWGTLEWFPAIAALTLLFVGFVAVQFTVLFGGQRHVLRTAGLSYAEYARSGFWQLTVVTLLTVAVLGGVSRWARRETRVERILLRVLLGLLSALSVVIVVSALSRMYTYQKVYSFTGERIFVMAFELLLGAVFLMILAAGVRWQGRWIPGATVGLAVVMLLSLAVLNPEDYAARRNIARYEQTGKIDAWYLRALSADATPALANLPDRVRRCTLSWIDDDLAEPDPWYAWNLGRTRARAELDRLGARAIGGQKDCKAADQFDLPKTRRTPR
ncbi:DUF4153 domain-containing protein [Micromonospora rifamycinica]|uniref:Uncharacterized protein n=1 Tax=Micromonospora rifamycinica TaxID=291594 RepID=A0A109IP81_9ACTN|nr:DUF4153 domain-containing protein [Micromonospora rifamycinica]KWV34173.1 hypothetical protein AWV63_03310 [Micromonospora rifamycinica]SCG58562.1 protein of unknown function [Micromonospora rifamycinica]